MKIDTSSPKNRRERLFVLGVRVVFAVFVFIIFYLVISGVFHNGG